MKNYQRMEGLHQTMMIPIAQKLAVEEPLGNQLLDFRKSFVTTTRCHAYTVEQSVTNIKMLVLKKYMQVGKGFLADKEVKNTPKRSTVMRTIVIRINDSLKKFISFVHRVWIFEEFMVGVDRHLITFNAVLESIDVEVETCGVLGTHRTSEITVVFDIPTDEWREGRNG